jgi:hypothetical protein
MKGEVKQRGVLLWLSLLILTGLLASVPPIHTWAEEVVVEISESDSFSQGPTDGQFTAPVAIPASTTLNFNFDLAIDVKVEFLDAGDNVLYTVQFTAHSGQISSDNSSTPISNLSGATNLGSTGVLGDLQFMLPPGVKKVRESYSGVGTPDMPFITDTLTLDVIPTVTVEKSLSSGVYKLRFETSLTNLTGKIYDEVFGDQTTTESGTVGDDNTAPGNISSVGSSVPIQVKFKGDVEANATVNYSARYEASITRNTKLIKETEFSGSFENTDTLTLNQDVTVDGDFVNSGTLVVNNNIEINASRFINGSSTTIVVDGVTLTVTAEKVINNLNAQIHINGGGTLIIKTPAGASAVYFNNAGIIFIGASETPGSAGDGTLRPNSSSDVVYLLNTGVIKIGSSSHVGKLGTSSAPLASLNNVGPTGAPVTGMGSIIVSETAGADNEIHVRGDWKSAGTFIPGDATVILTDTGTLEHTSINGFYKLKIEGGTRTLSSSLEVTDTGSDALVIDSGATLNAENYDIDVEGTLDLKGQMTATGGTQTIGGDLIITGLYDNGSNNVTVNVSNTLDISGTAKLGSGSVSVGSVTNKAGAQLTATSGELSIAGGFSNSGTFNHNNGTIIFTKTGIFTTGGDAVSYNNITKRGLGTTTTLSGNLTLVGALTVESGTLDADDNNITVSGNISITGNSLDMGTGDLILNPSTDTTQTFDPGSPSSTYDNIYKRGEGTTQLTNHSLTLTDKSLTIEKGVFAMGDQDVTISGSGSLVIEDTATLTDVTGTLTVNTATTIKGSFSTSGAATHWFNGDLTVSSGGTYDNDSNAVTVYVDGDITNNGTMTMGSGSVDCTGTFTNNGIFTSTSGNLRVVGSFTNNATFNHNNGTITLVGTGGGVDFTPGTSTYNNITKTGAGNTVNLKGTLTADGTLNVDSGVMNLDSYTVSVGGVTIGTDGKLSGSGSLTVSGDFTNNGDYAHSGTLTLEGEGTFTPGTDTYDVSLFTKGTVTLAQNSTFNFAGATWTNTGTFTAGEGSTVRFVRSGDQTLTTGGAPNVPAMTFYNIETDSDNTITFATNIKLNGTFTIAGGATVKDVTPGSVYNFTQNAKVVVSGTWTLTGSSTNHIQLLGPGQGEGGPRWTLQVNSGGTVNIDYVDLRDSELIIHGGSLNGKNVGYTVVSLGNLSPSWGPYDPVPVVEARTHLSTAFSRGDANGDGWVDLIDFNILASVFGTPDPKADFNGDGYVDLFDFNILANNFGERVDGALAAARAHIADVGHLSLHIPERVHRGDVIEVSVMAESVCLKAYTFVLGYDRSLLEPVGELERGDFLKDALFIVRDGRVFSASRSDASRGKGVVAKLSFRVIVDGRSEDAISLRDIQLLDGSDRLGYSAEIRVPLSTVPRRTGLLANYPNPFNPETWIPFRLAESAKVAIRIFDSSGRLVRVLDLGRLEPGYYEERGRAAHWDGRNELGEKVPSGMYFYQMKANRFSAVRRMVILK